MSSELVGIELNLKGYDGVMSDMRALDQMLNGFRGKKNKIEIQSDIANTKRELVALQGEMNRLKDNAKAIKSLMRDGIIPKDMGQDALDEIQNEMDEVSKKTRDATQRFRELNTAMRQISGKSFKQVFNEVSSIVAHLGSAMQSAGNALTRLTSPFQRFTSGMIMGAGYKALNKFTEGFDSAFNRADTMKKYERLMAEYETINYTAEQSRKDLDKSVTGLPIALDDAISLAQRYTLSLGDMERGTKLAIATNNAFLASMATESQRYQGMMQMQDLLNGKDLNSREWMSLGASMGKAINEIGKEFGYTNENMGEFRQELYAGNIATEDFLDALEKVGTEGGSLEKLARESTDTWEAFFSRVGTAASRFGYGIITSLDEIVTTVTKGEFSSVNSLLDDQFIPAIDRMSASVQKWIKAHPEEIADFFRSLKSINWGSIIKGFGEGLLSVADTIQRVADMFGGKDLSWIGRWMVKGNILGNMLTIGGGLLKGSRGIIAGTIATLYRGGRAIFNIRKFGWLGYLGRVLTVGEGGAGKGAIETASKELPKMSRFSSGLSTVFKGWGQLATMVGGTALVGWGSMKLLKDTIKTMGDIGEEVKKVDWQSAVPALKWFGIFMGGFLTLGSALGQAGAVAMKPAAIGTAVLGALTTMFAAFADVDMFLIKRTFKQIADATSYLNEAVENINKIGSINDVGGAKTKVKNAITTFNQIIDLLKGESTGRNDPVNGENRQGGLQTLGSKITKSVGNLKTAMESMKTVIDTLNEMSQTRVNIGGLTATIPQIKVALMKIGNMLDELPPGMGTEGTASNVTNLATTMANLKTAFQSLVGSDGVLAMIPDISGKVNRMVHGGQLETMITAMQRLGGSLKDMMNSLNFGGFNTGTLLSDMTNLNSALDQVKSVIKKINKLGKVEVNTAGTDNIATYVNNLRKAFDSAKVAELSATVITFAISIKAALDSIKSLGGEITIEASVKLSSGFDSSVKTTVNKINDARRQIRKAWSLIPTSLTKTISAKINANVDTSGAVSAINRGIASVKAIADTTVNANASTGGRASRNGILYRSGGGSIFKPRGTDKIPAMLTEGEYVHKKQAVDFFGTDFMRAVNNMDVRGAMDALLHKAGQATSIGRQSIVNNTVNNNQRITQNINTNNPNFASARMGRFVGAL